MFQYVTSTLVCSLPCISDLVCWWLAYTQDISSAAQQAGVEIEIPENSVQRVGEFKQLALRAEQDGHLRQRLQHVLKLSKEKWDEARDHAMRAVVADGRMRAWCVA